MEVINGETSDGKKEFRLKFGDDVLEGVLPEVCEVHERGDASSEFDQLLLNLLPLGLVLLLLVRELLLLLSREAAVLRFALEFLDLVALVDDRLNDVVSQSTEALNATDCCHCLLASEDSAKRVVVNIDQQRALPLARQ